MWVGTVICGKRLGAQDEQKACEVFSQTIVTAIIVCILTSLVVSLLFFPILSVLRAEDDLSIYFTQYYQIMLSTYPLMVISTILGMFIRMDGKPQVCMMVSILCCILNVLLDYMLVGRMTLGVQGSALASLFVQIMSAIIQLAYFMKSSIHIRFKSFKFDKFVIKDTIFNGSSEFIGEMASAISMFAFNYVLMKYVGSEGVASFTILGFVVYGYNMIVIGFGQGLTTLVSICSGANEWETAFQLRKITNQILFGIGTIFAFFFILFGKQYANMFGCSPAVIDMASEGFKFYVLTFLIMGYDIINSMYFTSCGDALSSAILSSLRGFILLLAFILIFPAIWGMKGVWMATPLTEMLTAIVSIFLIMKQKKAIESR